MGEEKKHNEPIRVKQITIWKIIWLSMLMKNQIKHSKFMENNKNLVRMCSSWMIFFLSNLLKRIGEARQKRINVSAVSAYQTW